MYFELREKTPLYKYDIDSSSRGTKPLDIKYIFFNINLIEVFLSHFLLLPTYLRRYYDHLLIKSLPKYSYFKH